MLGLIFGIARFLLLQTIPPHSPLNAFGTSLLSMWLFIIITPNGEEYQTLGDRVKGTSVVAIGLDIAIMGLLCEQWGNTAGLVAAGIIWLIIGSGGDTAN